MRKEEVLLAEARRRLWVFCRREELVPFRGFCGEGGEGGVDRDGLRDAPRGTPPLFVGQEKKKVLLGKERRFLWLKNGGPRDERTSEYRKKKTDPKQTSLKHPPPKTTIAHARKALKEEGKKGSSKKKAGPREQVHFGQEAPPDKRLRLPGKERVSSEAGKRGVTKTKSRARPRCASSGLRVKKRGGEVGPSARDVRITAVDPWEKGDAAKNRGHCEHRGNDRCGRGGGPTIDKSGGP